MVWTDNCYRKRKVPVRRRTDTYERKIYILPNDSGNSSKWVCLLQYIKNTNQHFVEDLHSFIFEFPVVCVEKSQIAGSEIQSKKKAPDWASWYVTRPASSQAQFTQSLIHNLDYSPNAMQESSCYSAMKMVYYLAHSHIALYFSSFPLRQREERSQYTILPYHRSHQTEVYLLLGF